jgi:hypothetical protein
MSPTIPPHEEILTIPRRNLSQGRNMAMVIAPSEMSTHDPLLKPQGRSTTPDQLLLLRCACIPGHHQLHPQLNLERYTRDPLSQEMTTDQLPGQEMTILDLLKTGMTTHGLLHKNTMTHDPCSQDQDTNMPLAINLLCDPLLARHRNPTAVNSERDEVSAKRRSIIMNWKSRVRFRKKKDSLSVDDGAQKVLTRGCG